MTEADLGWTAGIIDGEGHVTVTKPPICGIKVSVGNTDMRMLLALRQLWGGKIYFNPNHTRMENAKPFWHWQLFGKNVFPMLRAVRPYLRVKREQADLLLEMERWHGRKDRYRPHKAAEWRERRVEVYSKLKVLNTRGADQIRAEAIKEQWKETQESEDIPPLFRQP